MAFQRIDKFLKYIAANGNYNDIINTMVLLYNYSRVYSTGKLPLMKMLKDGKEASTVANLRRAMTGATSDTNSIHEFNQYREEFYNYVATTNPDVYDYIDQTLYDRVGIEIAPFVFPAAIVDCQGTPLPSASDLADYIDKWNNTKVPADRAICGTSVEYLIDAQVLGFTSKNVYLLKSGIQPENAKIHYNAPASVQHRQLGEFTDNRKNIVDQEAQVKPKSLSDYNS